MHSIQSSALSEIIYDADWSPLHETVLAAVTGDGKVGHTCTHTRSARRAKPAGAASLTRSRVACYCGVRWVQVLIWDLSKSLMDPVVTYTHYKNADFIADLEAQAVSAKVDVSMKVKTTNFGVNAHMTTDSYGGHGVVLIAMPCAPPSLSPCHDGTRCSRQLWRPSVSSTVLVEKRTPRTTWVGPTASRPLNPRPPPIACSPGSSPAQTGVGRQQVRSSCLWEASVGGVDPS